MTKGEAVKKLKGFDLIGSNEDIEFQYALDMAISALNESRPKGKWIKDGVGLFKCSVCGRRICTSISEDNPQNEFPFCHCGTDMRGKE